MTPIGIYLARGVAKMGGSLGGLGLIPSHALDALAHSGRADVAICGFAEQMRGRKRARLNFRAGAKICLSHHKEVAAAEAADRMLNLAEGEGWSRNELRKRVNQDKASSMH